MPKKHKNEFAWLKEPLFQLHEDDEFDEEDDYDPDYIPEGCRACGGDYPNCTSSCPLFDD